MNQGESRALGHTCRIGLLIGLAVVGFFLGSAAFESLGNFSFFQDPRIQRKVDHFKVQKDAYDVLFFGSSHVLRGIAPNVFDREMGKLGYPVESFNCAFWGMLPHEANASMRSILSLRPRNLKFAFIELGWWDAHINEKNHYTLRTIVWHDFEETLSVLNSIVISRESLLEKLELVGLHIGHFFARAAHLGRGFELFKREPSSGGDHEMDGPGSTFLAREGFEPLDASMELEGHFAARHIEFLQTIESQAKRVERIETENRRKVTAEEIGAYNRRALRRQKAIIEAYGAQPIYVIPMRNSGSPVLLRLGKEGFVPVLFSLNDPVKYPHLHDVANLFDADHPNATGAARQTTLLAQLFAAYLSSLSSKSEE